MKFRTLFAITCVAMSLLWLGCGVRGQVAREVAMEKIDSILGEMTVKRKTIENDVAELRRGVTQLHKAKIKTEIKQQQLDTQLQPLRDSIAEIDEAVSKLRSHIKSKTNLELAGRVYETSEMNSLLTRFSTRRKRLQQQLDGFRSATTRLAKVADTLGDRKSVLQNRLATIENQMDIVDSNRVALEAMRNASEAASGQDDVAWNKVSDLESRVFDLYADVEAELSSEDMKWGALASHGEVAEIDGLLASLRTE